MLHDMTCEQRVAIGANALQEAARDGDEISPRIIAHLKKQLEIFEMKNLIKEIDANVADTKQQLGATLVDVDITFGRYNMNDGIEYHAFNHGTQIAVIYKDSDYPKKPWIVKQGNDFDSHRTLKDAKAALIEEWS